MGIINHLGASAITFNQPINLERFIKKRKTDLRPEKKQEPLRSGENVAGQIASNNRNRSLFFVVINTDACLDFGICDLQRLLR